MKHKNNHSILLIRGLPGSGKSTLARTLSEQGKYPVYSVDDYFTDPQGNYKFEHLENYKAYNQCRDNAEQSMIRKEPKIFIDNTFTLDWEMKPYFELAEKYEYDIFVVTVENYHDGKNVHGISEEQVQKMKEKYKVRL